MLPGTHFYPWFSYSWNSRFIPGIIVIPGIVYPSFQEPAPGIHRDVEAWIKKCERCALSKKPLPRVRPAMGHLLPTRPLEVLAIDFTLLEPATDGRENVLVMTDVFTNFTQAVPTRDQRASTTAKELLREWFFKYGISQRIISDQG